MKVFYRPEQNARTHSYSPSAGKPLWVVEDWLKQPDVHVDLCDFEPASVEDICLAHDPAFVRGVLQGRVRNGFGNTDADVARSLPYTTGSLLAAGEHAVLHCEAVCSPTSGFHHAGYDRAAGFCTFNGLMVTALALKQAGVVSTVGILDADRHDGDGTRHIIERLGVGWIRHCSLGEHFTANAGTTGGRFERWLESAVDTVRACDLVIYQAGADPHVNDPLGGLLTTEQMRWRDQCVFERLRGQALVWNLAGGYQLDDEAIAEAEQLEPVLALHRTTAQLHCAILD